uniref:Uncharacterized protein n=1 Tax=Anguilla anguilla TaxID=7936 RepID=A0A0E9XIW4_ANGAN
MVLWFVCVSLFGPPDGGTSVFSSVPFTLFNCIIVFNYSIVVWLSRFPFPLCGLIVHCALLCLVSVLSI